MHELLLHLDGSAVSFECSALLFCLIGWGTLSVNTSSAAEDMSFTLVGLEQDNDLELKDVCLREDFTRTSLKPPE